MELHLSRYHLTVVSSLCFCPCSLGEFDVLYIYYYIYKVQQLHSSLKHSQSSGEPDVRVQEEERNQSDRNSCHSSGTSPAHTLLPLAEVYR